MEKEPKDDTPPFQMTAVPLSGTSREAKSHLLVIYISDQ